MKSFLQLWMPLNASAHGDNVDNLIFYVHWLMLVLFVGWGIFFVYTLFRFNRTRNPKADYHGVRNHYSSYLEFAVALIEAVLLIGFSLPFWIQEVASAAAEETAHDIELRVIGQQFAWNIHYPGSDGIFGKTDPNLVDGTSNVLGLDRSDPSAKDDFASVGRLYVAVDKKVLIHVTSYDVIHGFFLPVMRVKQDAIPGTSIPVTFTATSTSPENPTKNDKWEIGCSQLCGNGHYKMQGELIVLAQDAYSTWVDEQVKLALEEGEAW